MRLAIVKYNAGNIRSVVNAVRRLGIEPLVTDDAAELSGADRIIFPGVGEAGSAMEYLRTRGLDVAIRSVPQPVLAICLGMQLMCDRSEENDTQCLGILPYTVKRFANDALKVPQMGWNTIRDLASPLFEGVLEDERLYFVHSYFVESCEQTIAVAEYGSKFSAAIQRDNFFGVQFHPEKSGPAGAKILENFLKL
jgi:glutamine amidotransferase